MNGEHVGPGLPGAMQDGKLPWSEEAEVAVLGAMAIDGEAAATAAETLGADDFHAERHRRIFAAVSELHGRGEVVDVVTLSDELKSRGELDAAGGMEYLARLVDAVPTSANVAHHASVLRRKSTLRKLIDAAREIDQDARGATGGEVADVVTAARERLEAVQPPSNLDAIDVVNMAAAMDEPGALEAPECIARGIAYVRQDTLLYADPKAGKTSTSIAVAACVSAGRRFLGRPTLAGRVLYIAAEGDRSEILRRLHEFGADGRYVDLVVPGADPVGELRTLMDERAYRLVIVDTLEKWMAPTGKDAWKTSEVNTVLTPTERIIRDSEAGLVAIHHANAEGKPINSTAYAAWADVLRKIEDGTSDRERKMTGRARFPVPDLRFRLVEADGRSRLQTVDPGREVAERVLDYVEAHPDAKKGEIRDGVSGARKEIDRALTDLERRGLLEVDRSGLAHLHRIRQKPRSQGAAKDRQEDSQGGTGNRGEGRGANGESPPKGDSPSATDRRAGGERKQPRRCACGQRIGPTSMTCGACKKKRREVQGRLPDPEDVVQVGETFPHSDVRAT